MILTDRLAIVETRPLFAGAHLVDSQMRMCIMEAVAWVAGEPWTDRPQCACPVISAFLRAWSDGIGDDAHRTALLRPLIGRVVGSRSTAAVAHRRAYLALDCLIRVHLPAWLDLTPALRAHATTLRAGTPVTDRASIQAASGPLAAALDAVRDARAAAWAASKVDVLDAARVTRVDAAAAAGTAAGAAGLRASRSAGVTALAVLGAAAAAVALYSSSVPLAPTVAHLEGAALDLFDRMLAVRP